MSGYLYLLFNVMLCVILIFFIALVFLVVYNLNSRYRTLAEQLRFNHVVTRAKTRNTSTVKWVALITCVFLSYGIMMRCSLLFLTENQQCNDYNYKISLEVINSGINPIAYVGNMETPPRENNFVTIWNQILVLFVQ